VTRIVFPPKLSEAEKKICSQLANESSFNPRD
jgi:hypothetical protein